MVLYGSKNGQMKAGHPVKTIERAYGDTFVGLDGRAKGKKSRDPEINYSRLFEAMRTSRRVLMPFRQERARAVREMVGAHYSDGGSMKTVPVNLIAKYIQIVSRALVPNCPRIMLTTRKRENQPAVSLMQDWMNNRLKEMHFDTKIQRWVIDSIMSIGIMKVALGTPSDAALSSYQSPAGVPFCEPVDLDDFVFDIGCRDLSQASFIGHRYRIPLEMAMEMDYFDKKEREKLVESSSGYNWMNNRDGDERIGMIGSGMSGESVRDFEPMVDLWEVYVPRVKRVCTFASCHNDVPSGDTNPLRVQEWVGPNCGPYHFLQLMTVPGNPMPSAPMHHLIDLHTFINYGYRKLVNQMQRQKEVLPVRGGQVDDARNLVQASDGEPFACDNADSIKPVSYGGPNQVNTQFAIHLMDLFNKQAGNLDILGGTAPQSRTASQDQLLNQNAAAGIADMQQKTTKGISLICESLAWFWWYHPQEVMTQYKSLPGLPDIGVERKLYPQNASVPSGEMKRNGPFEELQLRVDPYSMVFRSPQDRLKFLLMMFDKFAPIMQVLSQQGIMLDVQFLIKKIAEYSDEPDIVNLFTVSEPQPQEAAGGEQMGGMQPETTRNYVRQSIGQNTEANRMNDMANEARAVEAEPE